MSLKDFANFGYEVSDEDYYDLSGYEEVTLDELNEGDEITGKPYARLFLADEDYKADTMQFFILSEIIMLVKLVQESKARLPMLVTLFGIEIFVSALQLAKA